MACVGLGEVMANIFVNRTAGRAGLIRARRLVDAHDDVAVAYADLRPRLTEPPVG